MAHSSSWAGRQTFNLETPVQSRYASLVNMGMTFEETFWMLYNQYSEDIDHIENLLYLVKVPKTFGIYWGKKGVSPNASRFLANRHGRIQHNIPQWERLARQQTPPLKVVVTD